jgi:hypothetical protein
VRRASRRGQNSADRYVMLGCGREMQGFEEGLLRGW